MPDNKNHDVVMGTITSRKCPTCGHHEIGYETPDGVFVPLRPGDRIARFPRSAQRVADNDAGVPPDPAVQPTENNSTQWTPWVPEPLRVSRDLCRKYGVLIEKGPAKGHMTPALYERAYRHKLKRLIEKEFYTPLSVILDRFFVAPHLASGNAKQAADAMWSELDEIREPVAWVAAWLTEQDEASLSKMIHPKSADELNGPMLTDGQLREALEKMSLEDFLEML